MKDLASMMADFERPLRNCLSHWFPKIAAAGLPVPQTQIVRTNLQLLAMLDGDLQPGEWGPLESRMRAAVECVGSYPVFMRTGHTAGKHDWATTCYVRSHDRLQPHVHALVDFSGCHDLPTDVWVFRRLIHTRPLFHAFRGMPITREFRFFADAERGVHHVQPYWPAHAIEGHCRESWKEKLAAASILTDVERDTLSALAVRAAQAVGGDWSIDFLQDESGEWWLTDMALTATSYRWDPATGEQVGP